jgi:hypothetical protein
MTPAQAASEIERFNRRLEQELKRAEERSIEDARKIARQLSSGTFSTEKLAEMGHPYAKRDPRPPAHPAVVNRQTGEFKENWHTDKQGWQGDTLKNSLINDDPKADLMETHRWMIFRPIRQRIMERLQPIRLQRLLAAFQRAAR